MKKSLFAVILTLVLTAALLAGVTALVHALVPDYPDALSADPEVTEKITGEALLTAAAGEADSLIIFGSSELKTTDICTHPANFFANKRCGFQVDLVGRGSCQSLVHALSIAGSGEALRGNADAADKCANGAFVGNGGGDFAPAGEISEIAYDPAKAWAPKP